MKKRTSQTMSRFRMRAIAFVIVFAMALSAWASMPMDVFASTSDFVIEDGVLTKYKGGGGDVVIPNSVTSIGDSAFSQCISLTNVIIPNSVLSIGSDAFYGCSSLTNVSIPNSVTSIGHSAFGHCKGLKTLFIPDSVKMEEFSIVNGCTSLTVISIPKAVKEIGWAAFGGCSSLKCIIIPQTLNVVYKYAFSGCESLTDVFFEGTKSDWEKITIDNRENESLFESNIHYNWKNKCTFNGHDYRVIDLKCNSWNEAEETCELLGGHLATLTSKEENEFVYNYLTSLGYKNAYFGFTDEHEEGKWEWVTGESVSYLNWHTGEPNHENSSEDYAMFYYKFADGTWNDGAFGKNADNGGTTIICEWDTNGSTLKSISVKKLPTKTTYHFGADNELNTAGLVLSATYSDGSTKDIDSGFTCSPILLTTIGAQTVTVSYQYKSTTFSVNVVDIKSIVIKKEPNKVEYNMTSIVNGKKITVDAVKLNTTGLTVTAVYNDGFEKDFTSGFTYSPIAFNKTGKQRVTVELYDKSASFNVNITNDYFLIEKCNNQFIHTLGSFYKPDESQNHKTAYISELLGQISIVNIFARGSMLIDMNKQWDGVCFGMEASMVFSNDEYLNSILGNKNYFDLGKPKDNTDLRNVIFYYHLCQHLKGFVYDYTTERDNNIGNSVSLSTFLENLVSEAQNSKRNLEPFLISYYYDHARKVSGHTVIVCGYDYGEYDGSGVDKHRIKIYDCNSFGHPDTPNGTYSYMYIPDDYSTFQFTDANGNVLENVWRSISYIGVNSLKNASWNLTLNRKSSAKMISFASSGSVSDNQTEISISAYKPFTLKNKEGKILRYDGTKYSGNMTVYSTKIISENEPTMILNVDASDSFVLTGFSNCFELSAAIDGKYYYTNSDGADSIIISKGNGIVMNGDNYSFSSAISTELNSCELAKINGKTQGECIVESKNNEVTLNTQSNCTDLSVETYSGDNYSINKIDKSANFLQITDGKNDTTEIHFIDTTSTIFGDANGDGKVNGKDATRLMQYLAGWDVEIDQSAADVNGDGKVNGKDATRLMQYLAGWDVTLG